MQTKFKVVEIRKGADWESVVFESENEGSTALWLRDTPTVRLALPITNPLLMGHFQEGASYTVTFEIVKDQSHEQSAPGIPESQPGDSEADGGLPGAGGSDPGSVEPQGVGSGPEAQPEPAQGLGGQEEVLTVATEDEPDVWPSIS